MKDKDPKKYERIFGERDLVEYFNDKCLTIYEKAKENHCYYFLTRLDELTKYDNLFEKFRNEMQI
jgi:hypothetical protein